MSRPMRAARISVREPDEQLDLFLAQAAQSKITLRLIL
jgi:hypothetical protein